VGWQKDYGLAVRLGASRPKYRVSGARMELDHVSTQSAPASWFERNCTQPHYDQFEYLCGTSGTAGNLNVAIQNGGNPFEGQRSRPYPTPAMKQGYGHALFAEPAKQLGYKPYPQPSGNLSQSYTNPLGVTLGQCTFCGFYEWFGCTNYSNARPQTTILPSFKWSSPIPGEPDGRATRGEDTRQLLKLPRRWLNWR
jgi:hypothetical protein